MCTGKICNSYMQRVYIQGLCHAEKEDNMPKGKEKVRPGFFTEADTGKYAEYFIKGTQGKQCVCENAHSSGWFCFDSGGWVRRDYWRTKH